MRTNGGGNSRHTSKFLANLYFLEKNCNEKTSNKNIKKEWSLIGCNGDKIDMISPSVFQAEQWMSKNVFSKTNQFFQIGENSGGCYAYGNVWCYQLINSGIALHLACFRSPFSENCLEGLGFIPGYWATNDDILKAIVNVTGDEELSEKLVEINSDL